jgi:hypothetical protein
MMMVVVFPCDVVALPQDPRQVFYGLEPGWIVNLPDAAIYKPEDPRLKEVYTT